VSRGCSPEQKKPPIARVDDRHLVRRFLLRIQFEINFYVVVIALG
jgi:hypothetical protein